MSNKYTPTTWVGGKTVGTADVMNNIEKGIGDAHDRLDSVDEQFNTIDSKLSCHIEDFRILGETDTTAILKASKSGKCVKFDDKEYIITSTIELMFNTIFIGGSRTIFKCSTNLNSLIKLGHSCKCNNIKIIYDSNIQNVIDINTQHISKSIEGVNIYDYVADRAMYNIQLDNILVYNKKSTYTGDIGISILAYGQGLNGWGIKLNNVELQGNLDYGLTYINKQVTEGSTGAWITDVQIDDLKMVKVKNGLLFDSFNSTSTGKDPNSPQMIKINNVSLQYHSNVERFAIIKSAKNIYFNNCMPWDFNLSSNKPYLVYNDNVEDLKISNIYGYGVEYVLSDYSTTTYDLKAREGVLEGSYSILPTKTNYTLRDLHLLDSGSYRIPMDDTYSTMLGLPTGTFSYGGSVYVFGGYRGLKTIMVVPSNINWSSNKSFKYNKSIFMLNLSLELKSTTSQTTKDFLNTQLTRDCWYEFKDVNDSSVQNGSTILRPVLTYSKRGYLYYDTTLQKLIYWTGNIWKTVKDDTEV